MVKRYAFTMIELIFAIVVIAISIMSLPMLSGVIANNIDENIIQEAIFACVTELKQASSAHWDENSMQDNANGFARVIDDGTCENNSSSIRYRLKIGHIRQLYHRRCLDSNSTSPSNSNTNADVEAIEDMTHTVTDVFINPTPSQSGYKSSYKSELIVDYSSSFNGITNNNAKKVIARIYNADGNKTLVSLTAYMFNIGEIDYYKKMY